MDIQKEREAFEEYIISKHKNRSPLILTQRIQHGFSENYIVQGVQDCWETWQAAKAQAVPEGFVLVSAEQMSQWGHMANCAQEYGCPECFEARGYAHNLGCEINAYFNVSEAQEPAND